MNALRIVLVNNLQMVVDAISQHLSPLLDLSVVGSYRLDDARLWSDIRELAPQAIVVDLGQVLESGASVLETFARDVPAARLVVLTSSEDGSPALLAVRASGATAVDKQGSLSELVGALRCASAVAPRAVRDRGALLRELGADRRPPVRGGAAALVLLQRQPPLRANWVHGRPTRGDPTPTHGIHVDAIRAVQCVPHAWIAYAAACSGQAHR